MENHDPVVRMIREAPPVKTPDDFTGRIMTRIQRLPVERAAGGIRLFNRMTEAFHFRESIPPPVYFFLTGFFFFVLGAVILFAANHFLGRLKALPLVCCQPWIAILIASWLVFLGFFLYIKGRAGLPVVRMGLSLHMAFAVFYGIALGAAFDNPLAFLLAAALSLTGIVMGGLLFLGIREYEKRTWNEQQQH